MYRIIINVLNYHKYLKGNLRGGLRASESEAFLKRYSINNKCGSKQTNFERTWICNEKFTILNEENDLPIRIKKDKNENSF